MAERAVPARTYILMRRFSLFLILLVFVSLALVVGAIFRYPLVIDDPFITYRYAQNLAGGTGFVYNPGERSLSTTTPLYALVLGVVGFLYSEIPTVGYWLSVISLGVCAFFVFRLVAECYGRVAGVSAGVLLLCAPGLLITLGLETNFYLALALGAILLYRVGRATAAFAVSALLTLTRNDGILLVAILATHYLYMDRARLRGGLAAMIDMTFLRPFLVYFVILLPWLVFSTFYFGTPFPVTLGAKIAQAQSGLWDSFAIGLIKWARDSVWLVPQMLFGLVGAAWAIRQRSFLLVVGAWAITHLVAYSLLGVAFYAWYIAPLVPALAVFAGVGIVVSARWVGGLLPKSTGAMSVERGEERMRLSVLVLAGVVTLILVALELRTAVNLGLQKPSPKVEAYERAAEWLAQNTDVSARIDTLEVGVIGYFDGRRTYDFVGLVDPMRLPYLRVQKFADGVRRRAAEYVIAIPPDVWLPEDAWFKDAYRAAHEIRVRDFYGNRPLVIYERADVGSAPVETRFVNAAFEKQVELQKVELFTHDIKRGESLPLRLNLRALQTTPAPKEWKFTIQLVGAENRVVAQTDNFYPARLPEDGEPFVDYQAIPIPVDAPPGTYDLILAMYDIERNERLSLYGNDGNEVGDFVPLGKIEIKE